MSRDTRSDFKFIEIGNTYTEYQCLHCSESVIVNMEEMDDDVLDRHRHDCSTVDGQGSDGGSKHE